MDKNDLQEPVTKEYLGQFTEDVLLPALANTIDDAFDKRLTPIEQRLGDVERRMNTDMVTKEYLDDKLADLKGDMHVLFRKQDRKVNALVETLKAKNVLSEKEASDILSFELSR